MTESPARTLILDGTASSRAHLLRLLQSHGRPCADADPAEPPSRLPDADVILLVLGPRARPDSLAVLQRIRERRPGVRCVVLAQAPDHPLTRAAWHHGAADLLPVEAEPRVLLAAIDQAHEGAQADRARRRFLEAQAKRLNPLTPRERTVLWPMVRGVRTKDIADQLGLKEKTVESHRGSILRKTGCGHLSELVLLVARVHGDDAIDPRNDDGPPRDGADGHEGNGLSSPPRRIAGAPPGVRPSGVAARPAGVTRA